MDRVNQSYCQMCNIGGRLKFLMEKEKAMIEANGHEVTKVEIMVKLVAEGVRG